jgi:hypothetical protein
MISMTVLSGSYDYRLVALSIMIDSMTMSAPTPE